jgi:hypothetical protein
MTRTQAAARGSIFGCRRHGRWLPRGLDREQAAKSEMTGCVAYGMTLSSRGGSDGSTRVHKCEPPLITRRSCSPMFRCEAYSMHRSARRPSSCVRPRMEWLSTPRGCRTRLAQTASPVMSGQSRGPKILPWESAVPGVGHDATLRHEVPAPGVGSAVQPVTGGVLPLGLGGSTFPIQAACAAASS